jgi:hypothetical protein
VAQLQDRLLVAVNLRNIAIETIVVSKQNFVLKTARPKEEYNESYAPPPAFI